MATIERPLCPYCNKPAVRLSGRSVYPARRDLRRKKFFVCKPCGARVGTYEDGRPLGPLANAELRNARRRAHALFDPLWQRAQNQQWARTGAYVWLADKLGIRFEECHFGQMPLELLRRTINLLTFREDYPSPGHLVQLGIDEYEASEWVGLGPHDFDA